MSCRTKGFALPTVFRVALAYDLLTGEDSRLTLLSDFNQANNNRAGFSGGGEWALNKLGGSNFGVALRGSYTYAPANNIAVDQTQTALSDEEDLQGLAFGGGLNYDTNDIGLGLRLRLQVYGHPRGHELLHPVGRVVKAYDGRRLAPPPGNQRVRFEDISSCLGSSRSAE